MCIESFKRFIHRKGIFFLLRIKLRLIKCQSVNINHGFFLIRPVTKLSNIPTSYALAAAYFYLHYGCLFVCFSVNLSFCFKFSVNQCRSLAVGESATYAKSYMTRTTIVNSDLEWFVFLRPMTDNTDHIRKQPKSSDDVLLLKSIW